MEICTSGDHQSHLGSHFLIFVLHFGSVFGIIPLYPVKTVTLETVEKNAKRCVLKAYQMQVSYESSSSRGFDKADAFLGSEALRIGIAGPSVREIFVKSIFYGRHVTFVNHDPGKMRSAH